MGKKRTVLIFISLLFGVLVFIRCGLDPKDAGLRVNQQECIGCNKCSGVCPYDAIRIINGKAVIDPSKCVECGRCVEVCPVNAIY
jgi:ferredoxin